MHFNVLCLIDLCVFSPNFDWCLCLVFFEVLPKQQKNALTHCVFPVSNPLKHKTGPVLTCITAFHYFNKFPMLWNNNINEMNIGICKYAFSRYCQGGGLCSVFKVAMQSNVVVGIYSPVAFAQDTLVKIWALSVWTQNRFKKITVKPVKPLKKWFMLGLCPSRQWH